MVERARIQSGEPVATAYSRRAADGRSDLRGEKECTRERLTGDTRVYGLGVPEAKKGNSGSDRSEMLARSALLVLRGKRTT